MSILNPNTSLSVGEIEGCDSCKNCISWASFIECKSRPT